VLHADGSFDYTPNAGFAGTDSFTYQANDGALKSAPVTVSIFVQEVAPFGTADSYTLLHDRVLHVAGPGVLGNDSDADGDPLTAVQASAPLHGSVVFHADGSFDYAPVAGFIGSDSFSYRADDGLLASTPVTVAMSVLDRAPVSTDVSALTTEDSPLGSLNLVGSVSSDPDGDALTFILVGGPTHGSLDFSSFGGFNYRPSPNYFGSDSFTYKANDGIRDGNVATVFLTVLPINDAPVAAGDSYTTDEDVALVIPATGVLGNDSDVENDLLSAVLVTGPAHGSLILNGNGSFTYTPNANYNGADSFSYKANDGSLDSNIAAISLAVNPVNDPPVAGWNYAGCQKNSSISSDAAHGVLANTSDPDLADVLTVSAVKLLGASTSAAVSVGHPAVVQGTYGKLTMNADGSYGYVANTSPGALPAQMVPQDIFTYTVNDGHGGTIAANLTVTVYGPGSTYLQASASVLNGGNGQSALDGGDFSHTLIGGNGPDWLLAGRGNDTLTGGKGPDTFAFGPQIGKDVITDFDPKTDSIQFNHALFANYAAAMVSESFDGHNTTFTANHDSNQTVTLQNVAPSSLSPSNFSFA
jgi:VCBS repeat-containing protein